MSRSAPGIASQTSSPSLARTPTHIYPPTVALPAFKLRQKDGSVGRMIRAKLFAHRMKVKPSRVPTIQAENVQPHAVLNAPAKRFVWSVHLHDSLQGGTDYSKNETETNHKLRGQIE